MTTWFPKLQVERGIFSNLYINWQSLRKQIAGDDPTSSPRLATNYIEIRFLISQVRRNRLNW